MTHLLIVIVHPFLAEEENVKFDRPEFVGKDMCDGAGIIGKTVASEVDGVVCAQGEGFEYDRSRLLGS